MNFIPEIETKSKDEIKFYQDGKLKELISYLAENSPFYKKLFADRKISPQEIKTLEDLTKLPTTDKNDIQKSNWDFLCVSPSLIQEYTSTSGTLGLPVTIALTANDLNRLAYNEYISFVCADGSKKDCYQLMLTLDRQFMAGIAYYLGIRKLGARQVRVGPGLPEMQLETIDRIRPTTLVAVPSFLIKLIDFARSRNIDLNETSVEKVVCIGESIRTQELGLNILGKKIKSSWDVNLYNTYASTEMQSAFTECNAGQGGHHHPELLIVELLDENEMPVKDGEPGEVTITTLGIEGMPLLRYKTGDISIRYTQPCSCGRNTFRLGPVLGRKKEMIKLKGTTLYPPGIFNILSEMEGIGEYVLEVFTGELGTDELRLHMHLPEESQSQTEITLKSFFRSRLRVVPEIIFTSPQEIESLLFRDNSRKVKRFLDNRKSD